MNSSKPVFVTSKKRKLTNNIPRPLNFGAGGMSTTFRTVQNILLYRPDKALLNHTNSNFYSFELTLTDVFTGYSQLRSYFKQVRIREIRAHFQVQISCEAKSLFAFGVFPDGFISIHPITDDSSSLFVGSVSAYGLGVASSSQPTITDRWNPSNPGDYGYHETSSEYKFADGCICFEGLYEELLPVPVSGETYYLAGIVTLDYDVDLRGLRKAPRVLNLVLSPKVETAKVVDTLVNSDSPVDLS